MSVIILVRTGVSYLPFCVRVALFINITRRPIHVCIWNRYHLSTCPVWLFGPRPSPRLDIFQVHSTIFIFNASYQGLLSIIPLQPLPHLPIHLSQKKGNISIPSISFPLSKKSVEGTLRLLTFVRFRCPTYLVLNTTTHTSLH